MNLDHRIGKLERTLAALACTCPNSADLAWPGYEPGLHCDTCGGERLIYPLTNHPGHNEPLIRNALPILNKAYNGNPTADLSKLTDHELQQIRAALHAHQLEAPEHSTKPQR